MGRLLLLFWGALEQKFLRASLAVRQHGPVLPLTLRTATLLPALLAVVIGTSVSPITNNDVFLHLTTGRRILETGVVPRVDEYSALAGGRPWIAHEWLSGVVFHVVEVAAGLDGLIVLKALVAAGVAALLFAAARTLGAPPFVSVVLLAPVCLLAAARTMERPHIFSYLLSAAFLLLLARRRAGLRAPFAAFVILQILWANLHGGFLLGPVIVALAAIALAAEPALGRAGIQPFPAAARPALAEALRHALLAAALVGASMANPWGWRLLLFPFELTGSGFAEWVYEWKPPFRSAFRESYMMRYYLSWMLVGGAAGLASLWMAVGRRRLPSAALGGAALFVPFLLLSLRMNRSVTDFALVTYPAVAATWGAILPPVRRPVAGAILGATLLGLAGWFGMHGLPYDATSRREFGFGVSARMPEGAADYLEANAFEGNVFNPYRYGAYLVWRLHPSVRVGMDSRNEVYGEALYGAYRRALTDREALEVMLERIDADAVVVDWGGNGAMLTPWLAADPRWKLVWFDDRDSVYLRRDGSAADLAARDAYEMIDPRTFRVEKMGAADAERVLAEAGRAIRQSPRAVLARVMKAAALRRLGRDDQAREEERLVLAAAPQSYLVLAHLGQIHLEAGEGDRARSLFQRALRLNPRSSYARRGLEALGREG